MREVNYIIELTSSQHRVTGRPLAAGHDMKVVQETLGRSSITIVGDTCTCVLPQFAR
jgi:hypothetical protein